MNEYEIEVCKALRKNAGEDEDAYQYYGDEFYGIARALVSFMEKRDAVVVSYEGLNKKQKIIKENQVRLIAGTIHRINFDMKTLMSPPIFSSKILELRAFCFMYVCCFFSKNKTTDLLGPFSIIVSVQRFLEKVKGTPFSKLAEADMKEWCRKLEACYDFTGERVYLYTPSLIGSSAYDVMVPRMQLRPYDHQEQAMSLLENPETVKRGFVCVYSTSTNSGKTFTSVGLAAKIVAKKSLKLLFCCDVLLVCKKVKQLLQHAELGANSIVCTLEEGIALLTEDDDTWQKYVLFIDEITLNAHEKSDTLRRCMKLFSVAPKWTYLAGANLEPDKMDFFHLVHSCRTAEQTAFVTITSNTIYSSVSVFTFDGGEVVPHMFKTTVDELRAELKSILQNQFKGRMYTPINIGRMLKKAKDYLSWCLAEDAKNPTEEEKMDIAQWQSRLPDVKAIFGNVTQLYADNIRKIALQILDVVVAFDDDYFVQVMCKKTLDPKKSVDLYNLNFAQFQDVNLVAHPDPESCAMDMFTAHISSVKEKIGSCDKLLSEYANILEDWRKAKADAVDKIKDEKKRALASDEFPPPPVFPFPAECQINTKDYCKGFGTKFRQPMELELIPTVGIPEELLILLYSGVGVYSTRGKKKYTGIVLDLLSKGKLAFLVTDVCYGFDYPFGCLFVTKEFSDHKSTTDIYQLMSRVGRGKMSYMGEIFIHPTCADKMFGGADDTPRRELQHMHDVLINREWDE